ncbi:MAG: hypothetical protein M4D80_09445 [Myxococcota bacterium]|nr:hypothetical protein [Deltaproteobacteria bacterium]MDQ3335376.1 hypothetical protein [Myxococcota bacterium]
MARAKGKSKSKAKPAEPLPVERSRVPAALTIALGIVLVIVGFVITAVSFSAPTATGGKVLIAYGPVIIGFVAIARGALQLAPLAPTGLPRKPDPRRWIYGGIALLFAVVQMYCAIAVIPNRLPSAAVHLWSFPVLTLAMAVGTLSGMRYGWWVTVLGGGALLLSVMLVIVRILVSAAFLAGVYGAFGKAAATFSFVSIALIAQVAGLVPIFHIRWAMSRRGKRAFGV